MPSSLISKHISLRHPSLGSWVRRPSDSKKAAGDKKPSLYHRWHDRHHSPQNKGQGREDTALSISSPGRNPHLGSGSETNGSGCSSRNDTPATANKDHLPAQHGNTDAHASLSRRLHTIGRGRNPISPPRRPYFCPSVSGLSENVSPSIKDSTVRSSHSFGEC